MEGVGSIYECVHVCRESNYPVRWWLMEPTLEEGGEGDEKGPHGFEVIQVSPPPVNPKGFINTF